MTKTNELTRQILQDLYKRGIFAYRNSVGAGPATYTDKQGNTKTRWIQMGKVGSPDIIAILPPNGLFLGLELKLGHDRLRPEQAGFQLNAERMGAKVLVVKSFEDYLHKIVQLHN